MTSEKVCSLRHRNFLEGCSDLFGENTVQWGIFLTTYIQIEVYMIGKVCFSFLFKRTYIQSEVQATKRCLFLVTSLCRSTYIKCEGSYIIAFFALRWFYEVLELLFFCAEREIFYFILDKSRRFYSILGKLLELHHRFLCCTVILCSTTTLTLMCWLRLFYILFWLSPDNFIPFWKSSLQKRVSKQSWFHSLLTHSFTRRIRRIE